jgi:dihydropteroate synthase
MIAADNDAAIVRVHDVRETVDALKVRAAYRAV